MMNLLRIHVRIDCPMVWMLFIRDRYSRFTGHLHVNELGLSSVSLT